MLRLAVIAILFLPSLAPSPAALWTWDEVESGSLPVGAEGWLPAEFRAPGYTHGSGEEAEFTCALYRIEPRTSPVFGFVRGETARLLARRPLSLKIPYDSNLSYGKGRWYCVRARIVENADAGLIVAGVPAASVVKLDAPLKVGDRILSIEDGFEESATDPVAWRYCRLATVLFEQKERPLIQGVVLREGVRTAVEWRPSTRVTFRPVGKRELLVQEVRFSWTRFYPPGEKRQYSPFPPTLFWCPSGWVSEGPNRKPVRANLIWTSEPKKTGKVDPATNREIVKHLTSFRVSLKNESARTVIVLGLRATFTTSEGERTGFFALASNYGFRRDLLLGPREKSEPSLPTDKLLFLPQKVRKMRVVYALLTPEVEKAIASIMPEAKDVEIIAQPLRDVTHRITFVNNADHAVGIAGKLPNRRKTGRDMTFELALGAKQKGWYHFRPRGSALHLPQTARFGPAQLSFLFVPCAEHMLPETEQVSVYGRDRYIRGRLCWEQEKKK